MKYSYIPLANLLECPIRNGLTKPKSIRGAGVKMIGMKEIFSTSRIGNIDMERVPVDKKEIEHYKIMQNDLLFARQSLTLNGAGKCSIVKSVSEDTVFESHIIRLRVNNKKVNPNYVYYYFNSQEGINKIRSITEQVAAAGIRGRDLVKLEIPYPNLKLQNSICNILHSLDDKIELNQKINDNLAA